jgi:hypothetical protein
MERPGLAALARQIADEMEKETYDYWRSQPFPLAYQRVFDGEQVQVEITLQERNKDYIQVGVTVDDGGASAYYPAGWSTVIYREGAQRRYDPLEEDVTGCPVGIAILVLALTGLLAIVALLIGWLRVNV